MTDLCVINVQTSIFKIDIFCIIHTRRDKCCIEVANQFQMICSGSLGERVNYAPGCVKVQLNQMATETGQTIGNPK